MLCPFVGGGFGCKGVHLAAHRPGRAIAARAVWAAGQARPDARADVHLGRPPPATGPEVELGADRDGKLTGADATDGSLHARRSPTSSSRRARALRTVLYAVPSNCEVRAQGWPGSTSASPTFMRAPGERPGMLRPRIRHGRARLGARRWTRSSCGCATTPTVDPASGQPWSSKHLKECYAARRRALRLGAASRRAARHARRRLAGRHGAWRPPSTRRPRCPASARVRLLGRRHGRSSARPPHDLGTGMYTILTQVAADALGLPVDQVHVELGDSSLPPAPVSGGSMSTASVMPAAQAAAQAALRRLAEIAAADAGSPLHGLAPDQVEAADGRLRSKRGSRPLRVVRRHPAAPRRTPPVEATRSSAGRRRGRSTPSHSWGAQFCRGAGPRLTWRGAGRPLRLGRSTSAACSTQDRPQPGDRRRDRWGSAWR